MKLAFYLLLSLLISFCACNKPTNRKNNIDLDNYRRNYKDYIYADSMSKMNKDSAFYYLNKFATNSTDSLLRTTAYSQMGIIQHDAGDYFGAQESYLQSLEFINQKATQVRYLISNYNGLGETSRNLNNEEDALHYFEKALVLVQDTIEKLTLRNNIATVYKDKKDYPRAIRDYNAILEESKKFPIVYALILSNLAHAKWLRNPTYIAETELLTALRIRIRENDSIGLNASYSHLSEYYSDKDIQSSLSYADQMYHTAQKLKNPDNELDALQKLIAYGSVPNTKRYFTLYQKLNDSLQINRNRAKNQFALIRYETEKYKADKLKLQKENAESKLRIIWWQLALLIGSIIVIIGFILYRRKKQQAIREQQLKTSQKVHDIVANGLYSIIKRIEYGQELEKNQLLDDMDILYEQSRNISYEHPQEITPQTEDQLPSFLKSFATPGTSISIAGYSTALWKRLQPRTQNEVKLAFQNLMINMQKHSQAKNVVIKFERINQELKIAYTDDGVGLPKNFRYGNGLSSTENRIRSIGGRTIFDSDPGKGLKIQLFIPTE